MFTRSLIVAFAVLGLGCAGAPENESVLSENDAVEDYIKVAELREIDAIRSSRQLHYKSITEKYIIIDDGKKSYVVVFASACRELDDHRMVTPDIRHERHTLRARFDTFRGCRIQALYEIGEGQAQEIVNLGQTSSN